MLHEAILTNRMDPLLFCGSFVQGIRDVTYPTRNLFSIGDRPRSYDAGEVYAVLVVDDVSSRDRHFFCEHDYTAAGAGTPTRIAYDLDGVYEYDRAPSTNWEDRPQPPKFQPVADRRILDSIEQCIIGFSKPQAGRVILIKRDGELYEITPLGKVHAPQHAPRAA